MEVPTAPSLLLPGRYRHLSPVASLTNFHLSLSLAAATRPALVCARRMKGKRVADLHDSLRALDFRVERAEATQFYEELAIPHTTRAFLAKAVNVEREKPRIGIPYKDTRCY